MRFTSGIDKQEKSDFVIDDNVRKGMERSQLFSLLRNYLLFTQQLKEFSTQLCMLDRNISRRLLFGIKSMRITSGLYAVIASAKYEFKGHHDRNTCMRQCLVNWLRHHVCYLVQNGTGSINIFQQTSQKIFHCTSLSVTLS